MDDRPFTGGGDRAQIRETLRDLREALRSAVYESACFELSEAAKERLESTAGGLVSCEDAVASVVGGDERAATRFTAARLESVEVRGAAATAILTTPRGTPWSVRLVQENGAWRVASFRDALPRGR